MNLIDTTRPWHERMQQARGWHLKRLHAKHPPNYDDLRDAMRKAVSKRMPGWTLAAELTPTQIRADYARVIRRNLGNGRLP